MYVFLIFQSMPFFLKINVTNLKFKYKYSHVFDTYLNDYL